MIFSKECDVLSVSISDMISDHFSVVADLRIPTNHSCTAPHRLSRAVSLRQSTLQPQKPI